jgi:hypothetical protein
VAKLHSIEAERRAQAALACTDALLPGLPPRRRRQVASKILSLAWNERSGFTLAEEAFSHYQAQELIEPHLQCIAKVCPLLIAWEPISRSIRMFFGRKG